MAIYEVDFIHSSNRPESKAAALAMGKADLRDKLVSAGVALSDSEFELLDVHTEWEADEKTPKSLWLEWPQGK